MSPGYWTCFGIISLWIMGVDLQCKKIPFLPLLLLTLLAWSFRKEGQVEGLIPIPIILFLFFPLLFLFSKKLGGGDIKLILVSCLFLTYKELPIFLFFTGLIGLATALFYLHTKQQKIYPLGPSILLSLSMALYLSHALQLFPFEIS